MGRTLFEQISDGQVQWAPLDSNFDTVITHATSNLDCVQLFHLSSVLLWMAILSFIVKIVIGEGNNKRRYPLLSGKGKMRQSLIDSFPDEVEAIDKFFSMLKVCHLCIYLLR